MEFKFSDRFFNKNLKEGLVNGVFSSVASKYDVMNDAMSVGMHRKWKKDLVDIIKIENNFKVLDVACGTGDIAILIAKKAIQLKKTISICITDVNQDMLNIAEKKVYESLPSLPEGIKLEFKIFDAVNESSVFAEQSFDVCTCSFGVRNFSSLEDGLKNVYKLLKDGGMFYCMEFFDIKNSVLKSIYDLYLLKIIPKIGKVVAKDEESYLYLSESIKLFSSKEDFVTMLKNIGFTLVGLVKKVNGLVVICYCCK